MPFFLLGGLILLAGFGGLGVFVMHRDQEYHSADFRSQLRAIDIAGPRL